MERTLTQLCDVLDEELERQQNVLAICRALGQAARTHDLEYLEAKTTGLYVLIEDGVRGERKRLRLVRQLVDFYQLPVERQTLTDLIEVVSEPWSRRLREFQAGMRNTHDETQQVVRGNQRVMKRALGIVRGALDCLIQAVPAVVYDARGEERHRHQPVASRIDQRG